MKIERVSVKEMKVVMNENRKAIVKALKEATAPMTLKEITEKVGFEVKTGCTNPMVANGMIKAVGTKKVPVVRMVEVTVYEIGEVDENPQA